MIAAACRAPGRIAHLTCRRVVGEGGDKRERAGHLFEDRWNEISLKWF